MNKRRVMAASLGLLICLFWMLTSTIAGNREDIRSETVDQTFQEAQAGAEAKANAVMLDGLFLENLSHLIQPVILPPDESGAATTRGPGGPFCDFGGSSNCGEQAYCAESTPAFVVSPDGGMVLDDIELDLSGTPFAGMLTAEVCEVTLNVNAGRAALPYTVRVTLWHDCPPSQFGGPGILLGEGTVVINDPFTQPAVVTFAPAIVVPNVDLKDPPTGAMGPDFWIGMEVTSGGPAGWLFDSDCPPASIVERGLSSGDIGLFSGANMGCSFLFGGCGPDPIRTLMAEVRVGFVEGGTCCDDLTGICTTDVPVNNCSLPTQRFAPVLSCVEAMFDPPCGQGACCLPGGTCVDTTNADCTSMGGFVFKTAVTCAESDCAPIPDNDDCLSKEEFTAQSVCVTFNNANATDSGVPDASCGAIDRDVWFLYTVPQTSPPSNDGDLIVSMIGSSFDVIAAVYGPLSGDQVMDCNAIAAGTATEAGCNDDLTGEPLSCNSYLVVQSVVPGQIFKIRVGGMVGGPGKVKIDYIPVPPATGDINGDGSIDGQDVAAFVDVILGASFDPAAVCAADTNGDGTVSVADVASFVGCLMAGACP